MTHFYSTNKQLRSISASHGFTLVEVLVAIAILSILMTGIYGVFSTISTTQKRLEDAAEGYHQARIIFSRIGRELRSSYININNNSSAFIAASDGDDNYLAFTTTSATINGDALEGLVRVRYEVERQAEETLGRLLRSTVPLYVSDTTPAAQRLSSQIKQLHWRFFDGSDWQQNWDSTTNNVLPQTVEMSITLQCADQEVQLMTAFDLSLTRVER